MGQIYNSDSIAMGSGGEVTTFVAGEVESLPPGNEPTVSFDLGDDEGPVVNFGIPDGQPGVAGPQGEIGPQGPAGGPPNICGILAPAEVAATTVTVMARTDGTTLLTPTAMLESTRLAANVRNCRYSYPDKASSVDCEILVNGQWHSFTALESDRTSYGPIIYRNAKAGYGEIKPYQETE